MKKLNKEPKQYLDYVVLHEMAHLLQPTHSKEFIGILDKQMPMWREIKKRAESFAFGELRTAMAIFNRKETG